MLKPDANGEQKIRKRKTDDIKRQENENYGRIHC
jgi:hypothetical protein